MTALNSAKGFIKIYDGNELALVASIADTFLFNYTFKSILNNFV